MCTISSTDFQEFNAYRTSFTCNTKLTSLSDVNEPSCLSATSNHDRPSVAKIVQTVLSALDAEYHLSAIDYRPVFYDSILTKTFGKIDVVSAFSSVLVDASSMTDTFFVSFSPVPVHFVTVITILTAFLDSILTNTLGKIDVVSVFNSVLADASSMTDTFFYKCSLVPVHFATVITIHDIGSLHDSVFSSALFCYIFS